MKKTVKTNIAIDYFKFKEDLRKLRKTPYKLSEGYIKYRVKPYIHVDRDGFPLVGNRLKKGKRGSIEHNYKLHQPDNTSLTKKDIKRIRHKMRKGKGFRSFQDLDRVKCYIEMQKNKMIYRNKVKATQEAYLRLKFPDKTPEEIKKRKNYYLYTERRKKQSLLWMKNNPSKIKQYNANWRAKRKNLDSNNTETCTTEKA